MAKHEGLLLKIDSKGNISGYMQENNNKIPIENTTIKDELISFSEEDFKNILNCKMKSEIFIEPIPMKAKKDLH